MGIQDPSSIFNVQVPQEVLDRVTKDTKSITSEQLIEAWKQGPLAHMQIIPMDTKFRVTSETAWNKALPHLGTNRLKYIAGEFVCREYAMLFQVVSAGVLKVDGVGTVIDFSGHHAYNAVAAFNAKGILTVRMVEPQLDSIVAHLNPKRHYVGKSGLSLWG